MQPPRSTAPPPLDPRVEDVFYQVARPPSSGEAAGLEIRGLREALKILEIEVSIKEAMAMLQKYDAKSSGRLDLGEFNTLVSEFKAFDKDSAPPGEQPRGVGGARGTPGTPSTPLERRPQPGRRPVDGPAPAEETPYDGPEVPLPAASAEEAANLKPPTASKYAPEPPPLPPMIELAPAFGVDLQRGRYGDKPKGGGVSARGKLTGGSRADQALDAPPRQPWGGTQGGVFGKPGKYGAAELEPEEAEEGVLRLLTEYAGGKTLHSSQQWVVRAMRALELRYQASAREEGVQRFNLEVHCNQLAHDLGEHMDALREANRLRAEAEQEAFRCKEALRLEQEMAQALREHNASLKQEREALTSDVERAHGEMHALRRENEAMQSRWQQSANEAGEWAQRAYESQAASRQALTEANEARQAAQAVERSMLSAQEYRLAEEAGYQMQTIVQLAPSKAMLTAVYEQPVGVEAWVPV